MKEEVIRELEREYDVTEKQLRELESRVEARKRREIQTLRRLGVTDSAALGVRYSLPDIELLHAASTPCMVPSVESPDSDLDTEDEFASLRKRHLWKKPLGWLSASPLFRPRSGSDSGSRKYRAMSADVVAAAPTTTVTHLRRLYTGRSEFYDVDIDEHNKRVNQSNSASNAKENARNIDPRTMDEIDKFEQLIVSFFQRKQLRQH